MIPSRPPLRCLWLARELPFPMNTGDRIYTGQLAHAVARAGCDVTFVGLVPPDAQRPPADWPIRWDGIRDQKRRYGWAVFSPLPLVTSAHATLAYRRRLEARLAETWDVIVLDHYGMGWALPAVRRAIDRPGAKTVVVHIAQNHEETLSAGLYRSYRGPWPKHAVLYLNHLKIRALERRLVRQADLVTTITEEDRERFAAAAPNQHFTVLTPGYSGWVCPCRNLVAHCPRRVVLVGSYRWIVKQQNLRNLLAAADARFAAAGIGLDIIGDVPEELRAEFRGRLAATKFHGFVSDVAPFFSQARFALVPEVIGGGFKLKFLDYIFGQVPVATIAGAAAGLPASVRQHLLLAPTLDQLVEAVVREIDDVEVLDQRKRRAFEAASRQFDWDDRGRWLRAAVEEQAWRGPPLEGLSPAVAR